MLLLAARALHFWAVATLVGGAAFVLPLRHNSPYATRLLSIAAFVAASSGLFWFASVFVDVTGGIGALLDHEAWQAFLTAPFGAPWAIRILLCFVAIGLAAFRKPWLFLALGLGFAIDQAWLGHAVAGSGVALQMWSYWAHVLAGFLWTGALVMLCTISIEARRVPAGALALFSTVGVALVVVIFISGIANARFRGVTPTDLMSTTYGELLFIKIGLFAGMILLALFNRRRLRRDGAHELSVALWLETALGLAVLVAAAVLGVSAPPSG